MNSNQKEILERVLLMMNYDSSRTLNENTQLITEQYTWPTILQQGLKLSKNNTFSGPEWQTYLNGLNATTLPDLMKIQKGFSDAGYGAISPDFGLQGFNKPNPTPASIVLENDIYVKSLKNYNNKVAQSKKSGNSYFNVGIEPKGPQSTLIPEIPVQMKNLFGKTSGQLLDELQKQRAGVQQKKKEQNAIDSGCPFKNKTEGDAFREWFNNSFPKTAQQYQLDRSGDFCNSYIKRALLYKITAGQYVGKTAKEAYNYTKSQKSINSFNVGTLPKEYQDLPAWARRDMEKQGWNPGLSNDKLLKSFENRAEEIKQYGNQNFDLSGLDEVLSKNEREKLSIPKVDITASSDATRTKYDSPKEGKGWIEPKTKIFVPKYVLDQGKLEVIEYLRDELYERKRLEELEKTKQSGLIKKLFSQEAIDYALKNCDEESVLSFFKEILDGTKKNKYGNVVGKYYRNSKGQSYMAKWDSPKIPCESEFWRDYGLYIQLGGMVAISILSGGLGLGPSAALFVELAADTALNLYSLKKSVEAQDDDSIKMDLAYVFLPLLMASGPVRAALKSAKFGDEVIESVESQLKSLPPNATKTQVDDLLKNMTPQEQRVIKELGSEEYKDVVQKASKDVVDGIKKTAKAPIGRKISNPLINILVYGAPAGSYIYKKLTDIDSILDKNNLAKLSQEEKELWGRALSFLSAQDQDELIGALNNLSADSLENILRTANSEKIIDDYFSSSITDEQRKKNAENIKKDMENLIKDLQSNVEKESGEDLDIEIVIE